MKENPEQTQKTQPSTKTPARAEHAPQPAGTGRSARTFQQPRGMKVGGTPNGRRMIALSKLFRAGGDQVIDPLEGPTLREARQHLGPGSVNHLLQIGLICQGPQQLELTHKGVEKLRSTTLKVRSRSEAARRREKRERRRARRNETAPPGAPLIMLDVRRSGPRRCRLSVKEARGRGPAVTRDISAAQSPEEAAELLTELCGAWSSEDRLIMRRKTLELFADTSWPLDEAWLESHTGQLRL